jgi:hypothetical protein
VTIRGRTHETAITGEVGAINAAGHRHQHSGHRHHLGRTPAHFHTRFRERVWILRGSENCTDVALLAARRLTTIADRDVR